jgi:hypothetical protein
MRRILFLLTITLLAAASAYDVCGQDRPRFGVSVQGTMVQPVFGLRDRFDPHVTFSVGVGRWVEPGRNYVELRFLQHAFTQREDVVLREDTLRPAFDVTALNMSLDMIGGGVFLQRNLATTGTFRPFITGGLLLQRWEETRAAYADTETGLNVPVLSRPGQWSAGFSGGAGAEVYFLPAAALHVGVTYSVVMGELWPTLALGLENVSTFHYVTGGVGLRYYF